MNGKCEISLNPSIKKTKFANNLILKFNHIKYESESNLKYLEVNKLNWIIDLQINSIKRNYTYEIITKSISEFSYEYNINFNFQESFSNSPELIIKLNSKIFRS